MRHNFFPNFTVYELHSAATEHIKMYYYSTNSVLIPHTKITSNGLKTQK